MFEALSSYIKDIALFMIFTTLVQAVMPKSKFKAFIGVVLGIMLVFIVLSPIASLVSGRGVEAAVGDIQLMFNKDLVSGSNLRDSEQNKEILRLYTAELEAQMKRLIEQNKKYEATSVSVAVSDSNDDFGEIKSIHISLADIAKAADGLIRIEPINPVMWGGQPDDASDIEFELIKSQISSVYSVPDGHIYILLR